MYILLFFNENGIDFFAEESNEFVDEQKAVNENSSASDEINYKSYEMSTGI